MLNIEIRIGGLALDARLNDSATAMKMAEHLPLEGEINIWGDEIYFSTPVYCGLEPDAKESVQVGDIGYWPPGQAFCLFFGQTPMSTSDKIIPASAVNIIGRITGDPQKLKQVMNEKKIIIQARKDEA
jgi:hypothetical protein